MPRPEILAKLHDTLTSLLLALAVSLAWPAMAHDQHAHPAAYHLAAAHAHSAVHEHTNHAPDPACSPDLGCCVMTHCHPGVAQPSLTMPLADLHPRHEPRPSSKEAGVDPAILVPPPRPLLG